MQSRARLVALGAAAMLALAASADAQDYPTRPIKVVIPFAAGSGADIMGRFFAKGLSERAGQPAIVAGSRAPSEPMKPSKSSRWAFKPR